MGTPFLTDWKKARDGVQVPPEAGDTSDPELSLGADTRTAPSNKTITHHPPI